MRDRLLPRWLFLRALALIYFSAFFSLIFQINGLIGPRGILPAEQYLREVALAVGPQRYWYAPTLFWLSAHSSMLLATMWIGLAASLLLLFNIWPRAMLVTCFLSFLSFIGAAQDFSSYQSDGMLLEAGFLAFFFAPPGLRPGLGALSPPSRASYFLLLWEWFRIYFESGAVKLLSGDVHWRNLTAMDDYYQNGPLPTWIGWYVQHLPHWFHATTVILTLLMELAVVWLAFAPWRRARLLCFLIVTPWEAAVILTANYAFLNYLVLVLGVLLLDDRSLRPLSRVARAHFTSSPNIPPNTTPVTHTQPFRGLAFCVSAVLLTWVFYDTTLLMVSMLWPRIPLPRAPVAALDPFRVANSYGLFAVMTPARYEIEFQGSDDGTNWSAYAFRYKPQALNDRPGIYAPYQPRLDWNLWFASLGGWRESPIVPRMEEALLENDGDVLRLLRQTPFPNHAPKLVRAVLWQYWFTDMREKHQTGHWWKRELLGTYAPTLEKLPNGRFAATAMPTLSGPPSAAD